MIFRRPVALLRHVGLAEGASFLALLFVAMPLKYLAGLPIFVQIVGSLHGGLFVLYLAAALYAFLVRRWSFWKLGKVVLASVFPGGPFLIDRELREESLAVEGVPTTDANEASEA